MNRFDGIKKVKVSLRRNFYDKDAKKTVRSKSLPNHSQKFDLFGFVIRVTLASLLILSVMATGKAGLDAAKFFKQDYIEIYAKD